MQNNQITGRARVGVVTVTYGKRFHFLSKVAEAVMKDPHVVRFVIVDNGSHNKEAIESLANVYGEKVVILREDKNLGPAGGFAKGFEYVRSLLCDYVFVLDDDSVPEDGAISYFLSHLQTFKHKNVVLVGNRVTIPGSQAVFFESIPLRPFTGTFFEVFSFEKFSHFIRLLTGKDSRSFAKEKKPLQMVANESFVYGGSFLPIEAVRSAPLPDKNLVLYGDDIEYSWGVKRLGYESYVCYTPKIYDIEMSFGEGSQAVGLFDPKVPHFKMYYRIRNMIRISVRNTKQSQPVLFINVCVWVIGLLVLGVARYGFHRGLLTKLYLLIKAFEGGYIQTASVPAIAQLP